MGADRAARPTPGACRTVVQQLELRRKPFWIVAPGAMKVTAFKENHNPDAWAIVDRVSFYIENLHYNLIVKLLNDRFGIQVRGGCACAGTYGHYLLDVSYEKSRQITNLINTGDLSQKPGWVRVSLHPTMRNNELYFIADAIKQIAENHIEWQKDYDYDKHSNEFKHKHEIISAQEKVKEWFTL